MRGESFDFISNFSTLWQVMLGACLATAGGLVANQFEWRIQQQRKERNAALFFGEVLSTVAVVLKLAHRTKQIGDPFGPVTSRMLRAVRRVIEIYERNRESLIDLRGRSDEEVVQAMLAVADSRFQPELLRRARDAHKVASGYEIPVAHRENTPERIEKALGPFRIRGALPAFPFGSDFDEVEQRLLPVLERLRSDSGSWARLLRLIARGVLSSAPAADSPLFARLELVNPRTLRDRCYRAMVNGARQPPSVAVR